MHILEMVREFFASKNREHDGIGESFRVDRVFFEGLLKSDSCLLQAAQV